MLKQLIVAVAVLLAIARTVFAGDLNFALSEIAPVDANTIRVYGLGYIGTPGITYNVDFMFDESSLTFSPILPSSVVSNNMSAYAAANMVRGGKLYDSWFKVIGQSDPQLGYPARCKECHGWDYKGVKGAYGSGSHYTGYKGIFGAQGMNEARVFGTIKAHGFTLAEADIWDLTKFVKKGLVEMDKYIAFTGINKKAAMGNVVAGQILFAGTAKCFMCHGMDGTNPIIHHGEETVGSVASGNPWEELHKIRYGHPGTSMPSAVEDGLTLVDQVNILTYAQTLPE